MFIFKRCGCKIKEVQAPLNGNNLKKLSEQLSFISVESRLELLFLLRKKSHCVCDLMEHTGMSQSLISHHLSYLEKKEYISSKRNGKFVDYALTEKGRKILRAMEMIVSN